MQLQITIELDNAAFQDNPDELRQILATIADRVPHRLNESDGPLKLRDSNGNTVGSAQVK